MSDQKKIKDPLVLKSEAIKLAKSGAALARLLGVTRTCVHDWGECLPPVHAYRIVQIYPELAKQDNDGDQSDAA